MNPNEQPQIQPDYSFITNQQNQSFQQPNKDNSFKFKLIFLGGLFVIMMAGIAIFAATTNKSVKQATIQDDATGTQGRSAAQQFFKYIDSSNYQEAQGLLTPAYKQKITDNFTGLVAEPLRRNYKLESCTFKKINEGVQIIEADCPSKLTNQIVKMELEYTILDSQLLFVNLSLSGVSNA